MVQQPAPKVAVSRIRDAFSARGSEIKTKDAYNLLAQVWGYKDWATARAALAAPKEAPALVPSEESGFAKRDADIQDWPTWVFCNRGGSPDEPMYVYPAGTRLEALFANRRHWHLIDDRGVPSIELRDSLLDGIDLPLQNLFVGMQVACAYPDSEEYGFPTCANEREVHQFLEDELGWGYYAMDKGQPLVDVTGHCRGDDGAVDWWVEARVHPMVHERLLKEFSPDRLALEQLLETATVSDLLAPVAQPNNGRMALKVRLGAWLLSAEETLPMLVSRLHCVHPDVPVTEQAFPEVHLAPSLSREVATAGALARALEEALDVARCRASGVEVSH